MIVLCTCAPAEGRHTDACLVTQRARFHLHVGDEIAADLLSGRVGLLGYRQRMRDHEAAIVASGAFVVAELGAMVMERMARARSELRGERTMFAGDEAEAKLEDERDHRRWLDDEDDRTKTIH